MSAQQEWWHDFFDDVFASVLLQRQDAQEQSQTLAFLENVLQLQKGDNVFDQCCGVGSVSMILAAAGYKAHGVDIIPSYIVQANQGKHEDTSFACADARRYAPEGTFDAAINWYTSFGYSQDDADNIKMLERLYDAVKQGGRVALDITNMSASFRGAERVKSYEQETHLGCVKVERRFYFDVAKGMRGSHWRYIMPDGTIHEKEGVSRLYAPRELQALLEGVGFKVLDFYGSLTGDKLSLDSERCICVAEKGGH